MPVGMVLWKWDIRSGVEELGKYPADLEVSNKALMQLYSQHLYGTQTDIVSMYVGALNIVSVWTGSTYNYFLSRIRKNAANEGYRCIWVQVEMFGTDVYFCAFNTTDSDILYFNYRCDHIHEIEIGKQCYDERYIEPDFDDTITKIIYIY